MYLTLKTWQSVFANDNDAFIPELWAQESLMILEANMVAAALVHRDFEDEISQFGDVVNTRSVGSFEARRKTDTDDVTIQDTTSTNVPVKLDQHLHTSFLIRDGEESKGFASLRDEYLVPGLISLAQALDVITLSEMYNFLGNNAGMLGTAVDQPAIISAKETLTNNRAPILGRNLIVTPNIEGDLLNINNFLTADKVGDAGTALREGSLGRKMGFDIWASQNCPTIATGNSTTTTAVNLIAGYAAGATAITVDSAAGMTAGDWVTFAGDMIPQRITGIASTVLTISPGLKRAIVDGAVVTGYDQGAINLPAGYAAGYGKSIVMDGFAAGKPPKPGQLVAFGAAGTDYYGALGTPTTTGMFLSRPLTSSVADNDAVAIGPAGEYAFGFHRNAIALVMRPLAAPAEGTGALSFVASFGGLSLRVVITYDGTKQGHLVTIDVLCGVKTLDKNLGVVLFG